MKEASPFTKQCQVNPLLYNHDFLQPCEKKLLKTLWKKRRKW